MQRRARPLLGTIVEVGAAAGHDAAFDAIAAVQRQLSRFDPGSDIARFNALPIGGALQARAHTVAVLQAARQLQADSGGLFDVSLGSGAQGWQLDGPWLRKLQPAVALDLGGIGKGLAVDVAVQALRALGVDRGWVNAGGDLRVFGDLALPVAVRDEARGGARAFAHVREGAFATSHYAHGSRSALSPARTAHVSVAAPRCLWADALTKVVAATGRADDPLLARYDAVAWRHDAPPTPS